MAAGGVALALIVLICLVIAPRNAPRETTPVVRNAAILSGRTFDSPVAAITEGGRPLIAVRNLRLEGNRPTSARSVFLEVTPLGTPNIDIVSAVTKSGNALVLRTIARDDALGLNLLKSTTSPSTNGPMSVPLAANVPQAGEKVFILGKSPVAVLVGISVTADNAMFVPVSDMVAALEGKDIRGFPDGLPVVNARKELVGLLVHRGNAIGFIPSVAVENFLTRLGR
jgi:hypothetical protein